MPESVPEEFRVRVACGCGARLHTYDTRSHNECCPDCGADMERVSVPLDYFNVEPPTPAEQKALAQVQKYADPKNPSHNYGTVRMSTKNIVALHGLLERLLEYAFPEAEDGRLPEG